MKNTSLMTLTISLLWILLFAVGEPIRAQQSDRPRSSVIINTDLVVTWAQITIRNDRSLVKGLGVDDFLLREEGKPQQISLVKEGQPVSVVILVDGMTCIWPPELEFHRSHEALRQLGDDAEIALMAWDSDAVLTQPLTRDQSVVASRLGDKVSFFYALNGPQNDPQNPVRLGRDFYRPGQAIYQAARYLEKAASPERRKIIIILAWKRPPLLMAELHRQAAADVSTLIEKSGTTIYGLYLTEGRPPRFNGLFSGSPLSGRDRRRRSGGTIEQFVEQTGGSILVGEREKADELLIKLADLIRSSYTIGYYPENSDFDSRFRHITLELSPRGKAKAGNANIKTRNGYRAIRPSSPAVTEMK